MSDLNASLQRSAKAPGGLAAIAALVQPALNDLIGPDAEVLSLAIEFGAKISPDESVEIETHIIRSTRTLIFAQARVMKASGLMAADVSAVFRRQIGPKAGLEAAG